MEKLWKFIESVAPIIAVYPRWAQGLFALTVILMAASLSVFLVKLPAAKSKLAEGSSTAAFAVTRPRSGDFITARRFAIEGRGADPKEDNVLTVRLLRAQVGDTLPVQGTLSVDSNGTWRYEPVEPPEAGAYDVRVEAVFGRERHSEQVRINYQPAAPPGPATGGSPRKAEAPTVTIEGPASAPLGKSTYFTVFTRNAVRGVWSIGGFHNEPVEVSPLGPSHQVFVEPTQAERVGDEFTLVFTASNADGETATATKRFRVVAP